jgi:hypothetical protein
MSKSHSLAMGPDRGLQNCVLKIKTDRMTGLLHFNMAEAAHVRSRGESLITLSDRLLQHLSSRAHSRSKTNLSPLVCKVKKGRPLLAEVREYP